MERAKKILQWFVGIVVGLYLMATLLVNIPAVQHWLADGVAGVLERVLQTRVDIGRVEVGWNGRLIVTDLVVDDQQGEEMLKATRVSARLGLRDLTKKRIRVGNAQLFGVKANLYQECEGCDPNFKFIIDALASKDTTKHTPLDLRITQLMVRRGTVRWEQRWKPEKDGFDPSHLEFNELNITAQLPVLTDDSLSLRLKRLDARERSGLTLKSLSFDLNANRQGARLSNLRLEMPGSRLESPELTASIDGKRLQGYTGTLKAHLSPNDFTPLVAKLSEVENEVDVNLNFEGTTDRMEVRDLYLQDSEGRLQLKASAEADQLSKGRDSLRATIDLQRLYAESELVKPYIEPKASRKLMDIIQRIGNVTATGQASLDKGLLQADIDARTPLGAIKVSGNGRTDGPINAQVQSDGLQLGTLLDNRQLGVVALDMKGQGQLGKKPYASLKGRIPELNFKGYRYRNIDVDELIIDNGQLTMDIASEDPNASFDIDAKANLKEHTYQLAANIARITPNVLNLTKGFEGTTFAAEVLADLTGTKWDMMAGEVEVNGFEMTDSTGTYRPGDIHIKSRPEGNQRNMLLISPFMEAQVTGDFEPKVLIAQIRRMMSNYLPSLSTNNIALANEEQAEGKGSFVMKAYNAEPIRRLLGVPLRLKGPVTAYGEMDSGENALWMNLNTAGAEYGNEQLRNVDLHLESNFDALIAKLGVQRLMKGRWMNLGLDIQGFDGRLTTKLFFNNNIEGEPAPEKNYSGEVSVVSRLWQDPDGKQGFEGQILPSNLSLGDTVWTVHRGLVTYYDGAVDVDSFGVSQGDRFVHVNGRASKLETDTLHAELQRINLEYIFSLINFHAVELSGEATGHAYGTALMSSPKADAYLRIPDFALNYGRMGDLDIHINWGERPYSIYLDGDIVDAPVEGRTLVKGYITPKKDIDYHGLDLNVNTTHVNLQFLNKWTATIFDDLQGRASGWVHIFGPFKEVNIEGDAVVEHGSVGVPFTDVRYHLVNDSVQLRPDNIYFTRASLYDPQGNPGIEGHSALVDGHLHHESFKNLTFDISIDGQNILGYDFRELGDQNFFGTVYATGRVTLNGYPGMVRIGIKAHPERGTTFTYNATSPDKITNTPFITYKKRGIDIMETTENVDETEEEAPQGDLYIDFDLDIDDQATMNLLMDTRSGDKITLNGNGHMLAHYYNKGSFDLIGTYRVERGTYALSLQEIYRKNFEFTPGGTISFNGEPYSGDLNLQAVYTVPSVSLNDINPKANFSNATTRVNCLMNIGGKARAPRITFDFDIPNANEEEKQMVRTLISTEEERNMQVIYLLGIGRFYNYNYANETQTQGTTAVNSLLSSTLSSTISQVLSNMIGSHNWNVGANLRTGDDGWNDMDVEGMLQGNLLNNRLIINGSFGYRENPVAASNFIGDFDVKYLLTRTGSVALKAYSETNDRYFTKSSLTTQGIGVILKKDFTSWRDIWTRTTPRRTRKNK